MILGQKRLDKIVVKQFNNTVYVYNLKNDLIKKLEFAEGEKFAIEYHEATKSFKVKHGMVERNIVEEYDLVGNPINNIERV